MPPRNFKTLTVAAHTYDRARQVHAELHKLGVAALPAGLPAPEPPLSIGDVVDLALQHLERSLKGKLR